MTTYAVNYALWTGATGVVLEYIKNSRAGWKVLFTRGGEKAVVGLLSTYLQMQNFPLAGSGLDANYIYNGLLAAVSSEIMKTQGRDKLRASEEQILCALIGHRIASYFGQAFDGLTSKLDFVNNMFAGSSGYEGASIPNPGMAQPSVASGNNSGP